MNNNPKALYIHIPFCSNICSYCDFYKMVAKESTKIKYIDYLVKEIELRKNLLDNIKTIYIGGGTPSCLNLNLLDFLFYHIDRNIDFSKVEEFTIEANPNDINLEFVKKIKQYHVNRISIGVQTFNIDKLSVLGRTHTEEDVKKAIKLLKENEIDNINLDLMYGINEKDFSIVKNDIDKAIKLGVTHLSTYSLILEDKTILKKLYDEGKFNTMEDDLEADIYAKIKAYLKKKGFIHYEISNFSRKNYQCKHNLVYWDNMNYIGVGAGASFYIGDTRYTNIKNLDKYFEGIDSGCFNYLEVTKLSKLEIMGEEMMLGLRKIQGVNLVEFKVKYGIDAYTVFPIITKLINLKLLKVSGDYLLIPEKKLYLSNEVLVNFI